MQKHKKITKYKKPKKSHKILKKPKKVIKF